MHLIANEEGIIQPQSNAYNQKDANFLGSET